MIHAVRAAPLLSGDRGTPPVDTAALADALLRVSRLADDLPEVSELDLNPVVARPDGVWCVDVRVRISPAEPRDPFLRRLLLSTPQRTDSQRHVRPAIPGSQPGCRTGLVLAAALSGLRPGQAPRDYRREMPPGGVVGQARIAGPLRLCSAPRVSIPVTWSSTATACHVTAVQHEERGRRDNGHEEAC